jgi:ABC-type Zn2+ transport system substrate-binding protein/surface adhesin
MAKFLRIVAVALLALMLPLQGVASVVSAQCMAIGHHHDAGADHAHAEGLAADGHDHASHSHDHEDATAQSDDGAYAPHCGPCTACCATASIAAPMAVFVVPPASYSKYFFSQYPPRGIEPQALDRPPLAL